MAAPCRCVRTSRRLIFGSARAADPRRESGAAAAGAGLLEPGRRGRAPYLGRQLIQPLPRHTQKLCRPPLDLAGGDDPLKLLQEIEEVLVCGRSVGRFFWLAHGASVGLCGLWCYAVAAQQCPSPQFP
jgi:hypothetical protein